MGARDEHRDARGTTVVERPSLRVLRFRTSGFLTLEQARFALHHNGLVLGALGGEARLHGVYDWGAMTGYGPDARAACTDFLVSHRKGFASVNILTGSSLVAMAVTVANLLVSGFMSATMDRAAFEARVSAVLERP